MSDLTAFVNIDLILLEETHRLFEDPKGSFSFTQKDDENPQFQAHSLNRAINRILLIPFSINYQNIS